MCRHIYDWNIVNCDVKQPIQQLEIQFSGFFLLHALTYWAEILHMTLFYCTIDQVQVLSICINFCMSDASLELRIMKIHIFPHFSLMCLDILSWNFSYDFVLMYYNSSSSVVNFCRSYASFRTSLLSTSVGCWSSAFTRRIIYNFLNVCPFDYTAFAVSGKVGIP